MKLCKDCAHFDGERDCTRWKLSPDLVTGEIRTPQISAAVERSSPLHVPACNTPDPCGPDGKHWVEAPPKPQPSPKDLSWWRRIFGMEAPQGTYNGH